MTNAMTIGERVAWYRRRRGMSQEVLAGLVGRTTDWLSKVENNRIDLDRLSVIKLLAQGLDVAIGDLLAEPSLMQWTADSGNRTVPALRDALMNYPQLAPAFLPSDAEPRPLDQLAQAVDDVWLGYQSARFGYVTSRLPHLLTDAQTATAAYTGDDRLRARALFALIYHAAASTLTKVGETDLAWIAADRGLVAAQDSDDDVILGSLFRSVVHALLANGKYPEAVRLTKDVGERLDRNLAEPTPEALSVYGMLFLAGSMAASRADDRDSTRTFLAEADRAAGQLGQDGNFMWTAFGPTNVAIHRVSTAMELGDVQVALDLAPRIDTAPLPIERRVRHQLETARAYSARNRPDEGLAVLLDAEQLAPEQVRYHFLTRQLVLTWMRQQRSKPSFRLTDLATRLGLN